MVSVLLNFYPGCKYIDILASFRNTRSTTMKKIAPVVLLFLCTINNSYSQTSGGQMQSGAAQYVLGSQDEVLMPVNVWGFVNKPGQYMVPYDTDLVSLLSYAGGPREEAKINGIKIVRNRSAAGADSVLVVDVKKFIKSADQDQNPILKPGDTVVVSGTTFHFVSNFFEFAYRIALVAQAYTLILWYSDRNK